MDGTFTPCGGFTTELVALPKRLFLMKARTLTMEIFQNMWPPIFLFIAGQHGAKTPLNQRLSPSPPLAANTLVALEHFALSASALQEQSTNFRALVLGQPKKAKFLTCANVPLLALASNQLSKQQLGFSMQQFPVSPHLVMMAAFIQQPILMGSTSQKKECKTWPRQ